MERNVTRGLVVDLFNRSIFKGEIQFKNGVIEKIVDARNVPDVYILPGLIDAHIHVESSMSTPGSFAAAAVSRGTTGVVSDPHEIANVLGIGGIRLMIDDGKKVPMKFWFGAPSCVPATPLESSGAVIGSGEIKTILSWPEIKYLAEMMNFPGVINGDGEVMRKLKAAGEAGKKVDGHAPGLKGKDIEKYVGAGISTDHECSTLDEAIEKISLGMKVLIREGSAARNLDALKSLLKTHPDMVMLCSDDLHPEMLRERHLDKIVARLVNEDYDLFDVLRACTVNPAGHYGLEAGLLREGDPADFIVVDNPSSMNVLETWIDGRKVFDRGKILFNYPGCEHKNNFNSSPVNTKDIELEVSGNNARVIRIIDGDLFTVAETISTTRGGLFISDISTDLLKLVVKERYTDAKPTVGLIKGTGLRLGAFASSIAHDSHNIICTGTNDEDIAAAINEVVRIKGGLAVAAGGDIRSLCLPVGGIMTDAPVEETARVYQELSLILKEMGCMLSAPFMTLSFMALIVIPELKLSDKGLFDVTSFRHVPVFFD
ncbi:MAG: adenine deaminase [Bacteroidales bacterium]